ncbi:uncharacterized protein LOC119991666 [Tripterygium wilfordii]|uniref:uncharacterized protein LOC119991666 n=1 Tax=Tripterygium wilfordii TaxID=458696 RepID=UPI0018F7F01A|nr:uncharacterized protein LOC119991666 [Tripterygium wilfordii]
MTVPDDTASEYFLRELFNVRFELVHLESLTVEILGILGISPIPHREICRNCKGEEVKDASDRPETDKCHTRPAAGKLAPPGPITVCFEIKRNCLQSIQILIPTHPGVMASSCSFSVPEIFSGCIDGNCNEHGSMSQVKIIRARD